MQAALMIRSKKRIARRRRMRKEGRLYDLPSNVSVKQLQPFPQYPPDQWVGDLDTSVKCAQGRAAWLERGRRCSISDNPASCHRRWVKRNRVHDASLGGSSDDDDFLGALRGPSSFANAFLYVGLGTVALGLVIVFVGTGEKGFKTVELRLIGPSLIGIGLLCCILRIFFCICPSSCISSNRRKLKQKNSKVDADHTTSLLSVDNKRVSIARTTQPNYPEENNFMKKYPNIKVNEGMETLRQIATTSLFLQSEKNNISNNIPSIHFDEAKMKSGYEEREENFEVLSITDGEDDEVFLDPNCESETKTAETKEQTPYSLIDAVIKSSDTCYVLEPVREEQPRPNKLSRFRTPLNQQRNKDLNKTDLTLTPFETLSLNKNGNDIITKTSEYETTVSLVPTHSQSKNDNDNSLALKRMGCAKKIQDGTTNIKMVQSAVTSFASNVNSIEPELVLSPAKLVQ